MSSVKVCAKGILLEDLFIDFENYLSFFKAIGKWLAAHNFLFLLITTKEQY